MKKTILSLVILCFLTGAKAQGPEQNNQAKWNQRYEQIQSAKVAFYTSAMELTPQEAEAFWPIYNSYWKEREVAHKRLQGSLKALARMTTGERPSSESEIRRVMDLYVNTFALEGAIQRKYYEQFLKVLSVEKVAKLYKAEDDFRIRMIHQLRGN